MGRVRSHTRRAPRANPRGVLMTRGEGYGFVRTAEGEYFVPASAVGGAFDGDVVEVAPLAHKGSGGRARGGKRGGRAGGSDVTGAAGATRALGASRASGAFDRPAARVVRVVERAHDTVVGRYEVADPFGVVVPLDARIAHDIFTMRADYPDVEDGALVRVRITQFPTRKQAALGVIEEVLGRADAPNVGVDVIVARHKLETAFSEGALEQARAAEVDAYGALAAGYRDLRERIVFTIDPADARDFDDALSLERVDSGAGVLAEAGTGVRADAASGAAAGASAEAGVLPGAEYGTRAKARADAGAAAGAPAGPGASSAIDPQAGLACWRLGIHIADVSHYAEWNSSIDLDARRRATSVYLVDRVIPMLPPKLSDDVCSLLPGEDRRTMTVDVYLDEQARVVGYEIYPALICSNARLTYDQVRDALSECELEFGAGLSDPKFDAELSEREPKHDADLLERGPELDAEFVARLRGCSSIAKLRAAARERSGGIDFSTVEAKVRLSEDGSPEGISLREKNDATELVEEAMILANETVAAHLEARKWPCVYRVHDRPASDALGELVAVFQEFVWFKPDMAQRLVAGEPRVIQEILHVSSGRAEGELVSSLLLRSMKRAVYRPANDGHYGLASEAYCHFTSPIRRYPDLVVHRMLRASLTRRSEKFNQEVNALPWICEHSSDMERVADAAARESQELKMIEYLQRFVGTAFSGVISGVASYGIYVRLECTAEGMVAVDALGDEYFELDPVRHMLTGSDTGIVFRLGQRVAVVLKAADPATGKLDFTLAGRRSCRT